METEQGSQWLTKDQIEKLITQRGISPFTRRAIIYSLTGIAALSVVAEVALSLLGTGDTGAALTAIAASAVGGIAGMAQPARPPGD